VTLTSIVSWTQDAVVSCRQSQIVIGEEFAYATDSLYTITADKCAHKCHETKLCQGSVTVSTLTHREVDAWC